MNIELFLNQTTITDFRHEVNRLQAISDALPGLVAEIATIDVNTSPTEAQAAGKRVFDLCADVLQTTPEVRNPVWLLRGIAGQGLAIQEEAKREMQERERAEKARQAQVKRQAEADAKERAEADRLRALLARHPA